MRNIFKNVSLNLDYFIQSFSILTEQCIRTLTENAAVAARHIRKNKAWIDAYVVYVENDGSNHYHTFECEKFVRKSFWVYNRKLAENKGYTPCPDCGG